MLKRVFATLLCLLGVAFASSSASAAATSFESSGTLTTHNGVAPVGGIPVTVTVYNSGTCTRREVGRYTGVSDADGNYSITWNAPSLWSVACYVPFFGYTYMYSLEISVAGDESLPSPATSPTFDVSGTYGLVGDDVVRDFSNTPEMVSENGHWWARRVGPWTEFPFIDVEGFDPANGLDSELKLGLLNCSILDNGTPCDLSCLTEPGETSEDCTFAGSANNVLSYLTGNGYTVWLLLSGDNGGKSMKGSSAATYTDGAAFQAMDLIDRIHDETRLRKGDVRSAIHGYSMGGQVVRSGLRHWCSAGTWDASSLGTKRLRPAECNDIGVWFAGDAPLEGATAPTSAVRYLKEFADMLPEVSAALDTPAAKELLTQWVTAGCDTGCDSLGGCSSWLPSYSNGCSVDTSVHDDFQSWAKGTGYPYPTYASGARIPGVAYSQGLLPGLRGDAYTEFLFNNVNNAGDHHLFFDTAGDGCIFCPLTEYENGGLNNSFYKAAHGYAETDEGFWGNYEISVLKTPTFIATSSALDWWSDMTQWWDYQVNAINAGHVAHVYKSASQMVLAWTHEHLKGERSRSVICSQFRNVGAIGACRLPTRERCDGKDNDGDELIDEGGPTCEEPDPPEE